MDSHDGHLSNTDRLLFGSGFVFGVTFALVILSVVVAAVIEERGQALLTADAFVIVLTSVVISGCVGVSLYLLAFPENPLEIPIGGGVHGEDSKRRGETKRVPDASESDGDA